MNDDVGPDETRDKPLAAAARRALEETAARRAESARRTAALPEEIGGAKGPEPTRFGDWEHKGRATDF